MKKKQVEPIAGTSLYSSGYILHDYAVQHLEGELLTFIESLGLRDSQEKAAKDIFRNIYYKAIYQSSQFITGEQANKVRTENEGIGMSGAMTPVPPTRG